MTKFKVGDYVKSKLPYCNEVTHIGKVIQLIERYSVVCGHFNILSVKWESGYQSYEIEKDLEVVDLLMEFL